VEDLDGGGLEDSGLVLFSRLEPIRFAAPRPSLGQHGRTERVGPGIDQPFEGTYEYLDTRSCANMDVWWKGQPDDGEVDSYIPGPANNCLVAFHLYRACTSETPDGSPFGAECEAGKGVAYVQLKQRNGRPLDVFWSHTQATLTAPEYETPLPDYAAEREEQLRELVAMVKVWSPGGDREAVILGDLNIDGAKAPAAGSEYRRLIGTGDEGLLAGMGFRDLWPDSAPRDDPGYTWSHRNDHVPREGPQERLDYVLWRDRDSGGSACAQHPVVERRYDAIRPGGHRTDLSDHFGAGFEVRPRDPDPPGGGAEPCSPWLAKTVEQLLPSAEMKGRLRVPEACHWLRFEPGTWTVTNRSDAPLRLSAWLAHDISTKLDFFRGDAELGPERKHDEVQVDSDDPFYLKICWMDPNRTGNYILKVAPNVGADPQHPVVLSLNRFETVKFGTQFGQNPDTLIWTLVELPRTFSRDPHQAAVELGLHSQIKLRAGTAPVGSSAPNITWIAGFSEQWGSHAAGGFGGNDRMELFVVVERQVPANPAQTFGFELRATTDHQRVRLGVLECIEQEDATGDDHARMTYSADGKEAKLVDLGDFDEGQDTDLSGHSRVGANWVRGRVTITLFDQDGEDLEDDVLSGNALDNLGTIHINPLPGPIPREKEATEVRVRFTQDGANYRLEYRRSR
jgi:endonuclease/exonuclease/phosphatase family metal-dependent hydrolase